MDTERHYSTELDWESGLTVVTCNRCQAFAFAGQRINHRAECSERIIRPRRRQIRQIKRTITFFVYGEIDENGILVEP